MNDAQALYKYVTTQIKKVSDYDVTLDKKGVALQQARSHKEGYLEALNNVAEVIRKYVGV
jgi:hypothetical protein